MYRALIFPGQGSQRCKMAKDFFDSFPIAKEVFQCVDDTLNYSLSKIIFDGTEQELALTVHTQPALMVTSIAMLRVLMQETNKDVTEICDIVAGHSLGEYTALCAAESISLEHTAQLLKIRAESIQSASPKGEGAMAACIGISIKDLEKLLNTFNAEGVCQIANDNVEGQIVISGYKNIVDRVVATLKDIGYRTIKLNVSAPFHSKLVDSARIAMKEALESVTINAPKVPVIANVTADTVLEPKLIRQYLVEQISGRVRWRETMDRFSTLGVQNLVEIGSGKVLTGLAKKSLHDYKLFNISTVAELNNYIEVL